jgi:hypothetical protein
MASRHYQLSDDERRRRSECMKRRNADPEFAADARERITRLHANPFFAAKQAEAARKALKRLNADPEFREASRRRMRRMQMERLEQQKDA